MTASRAKIFKHGGSEAVRLPKEFRFNAPEVSIRRDGDAVILEPVKKRPTHEDMKAFWARIDALMDGGQIERPEQPPFPERDFGW